MAKNIRGYWGIYQKQKTLEEKRKAAQDQTTTSPPTPTSQKPKPIRKRFRP